LDGGNERENARGVRGKRFGWVPFNRGKQAKKSYKTKREKGKGHCRGFKKKRRAHGEFFQHVLGKRP